MNPTPSRQPRHGTAVTATPLRGEALNQVWLATRPEDQACTLAELKEKTCSWGGPSGLRMEWRHGSVHVWCGDQHEQYSMTDLYREVCAYRRGTQQLRLFEEAT